MLFAGNGAPKFGKLLEDSFGTLPENATILDQAPLASGLRIAACNALEKGNLADLAYFQPFYLKEFIRILRLYQPTATIGFMMPHASFRDSPDTVAGWQSISETIRWMQIHYGVDFVIPVGTAIENLRASSLKTASVTHEFSRDGHHLGYGLARYVANATYFQATISTRFGISVYGNSAVHAVTEGEMASPSYTYPDDCVDVTNANKGLAQICAICACDDMFTITPPDSIGDTL